MIKIHSPFAVPMAFARREDTDGLNAQLHQLFLERERAGNRYANPNPYTQRNDALFESHFDLFRWPDPPVQKLREFCFENLMRTVVQLNGYDQAFAQRLRIGVDAWFHVTRRGGYFGLHNHPMATWSGVYCVSGGDHDPDSQDSGQLQFVNPFIMTNMFIDAGIAQMQGQFTTQNRGWQLEAGQLVLFPSWLLHEVKPFHGEGERITVAFNCWFQVDKT